jgi:hypothetical protein
LGSSIASVASIASGGAIFVRAGGIATSATISTGATKRHGGITHVRIRGGGASIGAYCFAISAWSAIGGWISGHTRRSRRPDSTVFGIVVGIARWRQGEHAKTTEQNEKPSF